MSRSILSPCNQCRHSTLFYQHSLTFRLPHQSFRAYATKRHPRPNKPVPKPVREKPGLSTRTSAVPLQSVLPTQHPSSFIKPPAPLINPPASTHPPPLTLPDRGANDPAYKYYFRLGKAYATFYKTGLKNLWANYRTARRLPNSVWAQNPTKIRKAVENGTLSRADFQLIRRTKSDLYKLPPFILLWIICGEFTPLVIIFVTGLVPRLIWIPKQVQGAREKAEQRRRICKEESRFVRWAGAATILQDDIHKFKGEMRSDAYKYLAQVLGLYSSVWDRYIPSLIPSGLVRRRVEERLRDLKVDDFAIDRDGGVRDMSNEEVIRACEERGIDVLDQLDQEEHLLRKELSMWVDERRRLRIGLEEDD